MNNFADRINEEEFNQFRQGDQKSFRKIFDAYQQLIYKYILSYCKDTAEAEELVQEVFITLFINRLKIDNRAGIYPYLFVVAKRMTISNFKRKIVQSKYIHYLGSSWTEECYDTEKDLEASELLKNLQSIIRRLPARQQEVFYMNRFESLSYEEIAHKTGLSIHTVKNHLVAASKRVKWEVAKIYILLLIIKIFFVD